MKYVLDPVTEDCQVKCFEEYVNLETYDKITKLDLNIVPPNSGAGRYIGNGRLKRLNVMTYLVTEKGNTLYYCQSDKSPKDSILLNCSKSTQSHEMSFSDYVLNSCFYLLQRAFKYDQLLRSKVTFDGVQRPAISMSIPSPVKVEEKEDEVNVITYLHVEDCSIDKYRECLNEGFAISKIYDRPTEILERIERGEIHGI